MDKRIKKLITMLILFVMMFQIMLPTSLALTKEEYEEMLREENEKFKQSITREEFQATEFEKDGEKRYEYKNTTYKVAEIQDGTGWYSINGWDFGGEEIIHFNESGERERVTESTSDSINSTGYPIYFLNTNYVYYIPETMNVSYYRYDHNMTIIEGLEAMLADFIFGIASGLHYLVGSALGEALTIDDIVFNNYEEVNISFFANDATGHSKLIYGDGDVKGLNSIIPSWYSFFMKIALMGYMAILVYMGIKILLKSTAEKKADYKKLFTDWVIGLAILMLFPYAMKYMIKANEAIVETIEANKGYDDTVSGTIASENVDYDKETIIVDEEIMWENGTDYMSKMASAAEKNKKIALSFAFLIMTWQLITLIFHYYKRLFMIAFLITIFPLVAFTYAIDKIADGKSQAFNTWAKEFILNVFVQSFHAVVYVFVCSTVYSVSSGAIGFDYILIIVGVMFLFTGEEIIRKIFGQESSAGTMGSLANTAAGYYAKAALVTKVAKGVASRTVGEKSIPRKIYKSSQKMRMYDAKLAAFDKLATTSEDYNIGARLEHYNDAPAESAPNDQKEYFFKNREKYFNAVAILNNPNSHSYEEKAKALETVKDLAKMQPEKDDIGLKKLKKGVFNDLNMNEAQVLAIVAIDHDVQHMLNAGMERVDIEREVTARLGVIFTNETKEQITERANTYFTGMFLNGTSSTVTRNSVKEEIKDIFEEVDNIQSRVVFASDSNPLDEDEIIKIRRKVEEDAKEIYDLYEDESDYVFDMAKKYAQNIAILKNSNRGAYTETEILEAATYLREHAQDNEVLTEILEDDFDADIDMFTHAVAKKIVEEPNNNSRDNDYQRAKKIAKDIVDDYENESREGYFDDEISIHQVMKLKPKTSNVDEFINNNEELEEIIDNVFESRKEAMEEATSDLAREYLADSQISINEGSQDTEVRTLDGETYEEILMRRNHERGMMLKNIAAVNRSNARSDSLGVNEMIMKNYINRRDNERTGIDKQMRDRSTRWNRFKDTTKHIWNEATSEETVLNYIDKRKQEREDIDNAHFLGDIGDKK